jgi:O-antigen ligase
MYTNSGADSDLGRAADATWGARCLNVTRIMAIAAAALVPASTAAASVAIVLMLVSWFASGRAVETLRASAAQRVGQAMLVFLALLLIDMLYGSATWAERWDSLWSWRKLVFGFIVLGFFAEELWKQRFLKAFVLVAAAGLILSFIAWLGVIPSKAGHQPGVLLTNHATQGITFAIAALCCLELQQEAGRRDRMLLLAGALLFVLSVVFISTSRSAYLALMCIALVWGGARLGWRRLPLVVGATVVAALLAFSLSSTLRERVQQGVDEARAYQTAPAYTSAGVRVVFLMNTLDLVKDRPLLGYGTGSFARKYNQRFAGPGLDWRGMPTSDPHNQYLFIAVENGLLGLAVFVGLLAAMFWEARRADVYHVIIRGALLAWCVTSLFSSHFRTFPEGHLIWLFAGAMLAAAPSRPLLRNQVSFSAGKTT